MLFYIVTASLDGLEIMPGIVNAGSSILPGRHAGNSFKHSYEGADVLIAYLNGNLLNAAIAFH